MTRQKAIKIAAIASYLLIILMGDMIGIPLFFWLLFTLFEFSNPDQLYALFAVIGLTISFKILNSSRTLRIALLDIVCFVLLVSPLARRMIVVPIENFNYLAFIIPATIFAFLYFLSFYISIRQYQQIRKASGWERT